jgi:uncharacterized protein (DUF58 family)
MADTLLTAEAVSKLGTLDLIAKRLVEGFMAGLHRSPYHGFSVEFMQHRPYEPGDELRHVDWRLFARSERYCVKQYEEETNLRCHILLDGSASMNFGTTGVTKFQWAKMMAASLAWLMVRQGDAVGLTIFDQVPRVEMPARSLRSHLNRVLIELERFQPGGETCTAAVLHSMAEKLTRRSLVVLISDLIDDEAELMNGLKHFRFAGHEVLVILPMDPAELDFSKFKSRRFIDSETGSKMAADPHQIADAVNAESRRFYGRLRLACINAQVDLLEASVQRPFDDVLLEYLMKRRRLS